MMLKVLASGASMFEEGDLLGIGPFSWNPFAEPKIGKSLTKCVPLELLNVELLNEEKAKSFLGAAGLGLAGAALAGTLGLVLGVIAGGNKKSKVYALSYKDLKIVVETSNSSDQKKRKTRSRFGGRPTGIFSSADMAT